MASLPPTPVRLLTTAKSEPSLLNMSGSSNSSPTDFAFEAPHPDPTLKMSSTPSSTTFTPMYPFSAGLPPYNYSSASSFSSGTSGSIDGNSFSSTDLPAISRDFARPSNVETRRPNTAGGALPSGDRFQRLEIGETIDEGSIFSNPFTSPRDGKTVPSQSAEIDPRYAAAQAASRRASEGGNFMLPPSWPAQMQGMNSAPINNHYSFMQQMQAQRPSLNLDNRPQTSDGLPTYSGLNTHVALPSARSIVGQVDGFGGAYGLSPAAQIAGDKSMPFRDARANSMSSMNRPQFLPKAPEAKSSEITFVPLGGPAPKKRPRRRYDEIERLYSCGWNGCEKSYGTLNHLNAHVAMQKHGEKRLPSEFKDMRKAWRKKKREHAAAAANAQYMQNGGWARNSLSSSSESDFDRRDSTMSMSGDSSFYGGYDSRPTTASSVASSVDPSRMAGFDYHSQQPSVPMLHAVPASARRPSVPNHIPMPNNSLDGGFRMADGDHPTPTPQNPFPGQSNAPRGGFPFQTLTQPMPVQMANGMNQGYGQFAFQR